MESDRPGAHRKAKCGGDCVSAQARQNDAAPASKIAGYAFGLSPRGRALELLQRTRGKMGNPSTLVVWRYASQIAPI